MTVISAGFEKPDRKSPVVISEPSGLSTGKTEKMTMKAETDPRAIVSIAYRSTAYRTTVDAITTKVSAIAISTESIHLPKATLANFTNLHFKAGGPGNGRALR